MSSSQNLHIINDMSTEKLENFDRLCIHTITTKPWSIEEIIENIYVEIFQFMSFQFDPPNSITSFSERTILSSIKNINQ